jgi:hypothetical protein
MMESAKIKAEADLQEALHPSTDELMLIYSFWSTKFPYWTVEEAAALLMGSDPRLVCAAYDVLPRDDRKTFDLFVDIIRRKFPTEVHPADLRDYASTINVVNDLLWSAIDYYCPSKKPIRKSSETVNENTRNKLAYGLALRYGYRSSNRTNEAVGIIQRKLEEVGIPITDDTIRKHLRKLAQDPVLAKVEADLCSAEK